MDLRGRMAGALATLAGRLTGNGKMVHGAAPMWSWFLPSTKFDYEKEAGDLLKSSVVVAALCWLMRTFPEAPAVVQALEDAESDLWRNDPDDRVSRLLRQPNPFYGGRTLWAATIAEYVFGDAYWIKERNNIGRVIRLWWCPRALITPMDDPQRRPDQFITHYRYTPAGRQIDLRPEDVVHFRFGMHPANPKRGFSQLAAVVREVYTDDQASNFTASVLRNLGIIGVAISPKEGVIPASEVKETKKYVDEHFAGDDRARALAFARPTEMQAVQYNLQGFDMGPIRDISEERVSAAVGIPAAVIGFGTGLQQTKVGATMKELIQLAWKQGVIPYHAPIAEELDRSLLSEFRRDEDVATARPSRRVAFDTSRVAMLWEDAKERDERVLGRFEKGAISLEEVRRELGYKVEAQHKGVWFRPAGVVVVAKPGDQPPQPPAPAGAPAKPKPEARPAEASVEEDGEMEGKSRALVKVEALEGGEGSLGLVVRPQIVLRPEIKIENHIPAVPPTPVTVHAPVTVQAPEPVDEVEITKDTTGRTRVRRVRKS